MTSDEELRRAVAGATATTLFQRTVTQASEATALRWRTGPAGAGSMTWSEYADRACRLAAALRGLGVGAGDRVILLMTNRPEFYVCDMAVMLAGATPVSIYNSSSPEQIRYVAAHCGAVAAIAGDLGFLGRIRQVSASLGDLRHLLVVDDPDGSADRAVLRVAELQAGPADDLTSAVGRLRPDDLLTLIYTSGTTGPPKSVMLTHANICWLLESWARAMGADGASRPMGGWRMISYLPMAHIAERLFSYYLHMAHGSEVTTCPDPTQVNDYLGTVRPNCFFGPPRVWEKFHGAIRSSAPEGIDAMLTRRDAEEMRALRALIGLEDCHMALTGAAPMHPDVHRFLLDIGIPLSEIYGLSECTGPMTWSPHRVRTGTVGPPIPGQEVRIAADGEVLARGGNVFTGYLDDAVRTAEVLDGDGWLHTGDVGSFDDDGYLRILDRKKELIITAGGKNISPANLEAALKSFPLIGQACAVGDRRPYVTALIVLDANEAQRWAQARGLGDLTLGEIAASAELHTEISENVDVSNARFSRVEQVKAFAVLSAEWMPDSEELTATMKLKRRAIHEKYATEIDGLYAGTCP